MSYKLFTDKQEIFECRIHIEGASMKKAQSRIVVSSSDIKLMFEGTIDKNGNCKVPIKKLKGLLDENTKGTMILEVISEDVYFQPWESDFEVDTAKKIKVEVKQQEKPSIKSSKPRMIVSEVKHPFSPVDKIVETFNKQGVDVNTIYKSRKKMIPILKEYSNNAGYKKGVKNFIKEVIQKLSKK